MKDLLQSLLIGRLLIHLNISHNHMTNNYQLLKSKLMKLTCHTLPNILMDSGINSDSDPQLECLLMKRELIITVLLVLPKKILIVHPTIWETELYPYSSTLGIPLKTQPTLLVLMTSEDKKPMSVKISNSNILMLMVFGSMSIMVSLLKKTKSIPPLLVKTTTRLSLSQLLTIILLLPNLFST